MIYFLPYSATEIRSPFKNYKTAQELIKTIKKRRKNHAVFFKKTNPSGSAFLIPWRKNTIQFLLFMSKISSYFYITKNPNMWHSEILPNWDHEVNTNSIRKKYKNFKKKVKTKTDQEWSAFVWIANPQRLAICFLIIFKRFSTENSI